MDRYWAAIVHGWDFCYNEEKDGRGGETVKKKITLIVALLICLVVCAGGIFASRYQRTSDKRLPDRYGTEIVRLQSSEDKDGDGIDDQTDILQGALMYVGTHPKYKSRYYQTGYPNDGYGVCTDVVAYALQNAGYDLMELVARDIQENPDGYDIDQPDKKIDFRRVRNLKVYFADTAIPLTTSLADIEQWQGGDIVIFESHIGIVSDRRNADGVPYVIHHNDPFQKSYEEDILESRGNIVGHYRVSE